MPNVMIIGLDGGTFDLIHPWVNQGKLPNIAKLIRSGAHHSLRSTIPPMTFPAWNAFMTGKNPGKHGVFDFMQRKPGTYDLDIMNATHRKCPTTWRIASQSGKRCAVLGVPVTYPPEQINGVMISGFDAPFTDDRIMFPRELSQELREKVGPYIVSADFTKHLKAGQIDQALNAIHGSIDRKAETAKYILRREPWDLFMIVFGETDVAIHYFWKYHDPDSPQRSQRRAAHIGLDPIYEIYSRVDTHIGELLELASPETTVIMMSDHGAGGACNKAIHLNRFMEIHDLLKFKRLPVTNQIHKTLDQLKSSVRVVLPDKIIKRLRFAPKSMGLKWESKLRFSSIDWASTKVYAEETPYYPNLRINLKGREPDGIVDRHDYDRLVERVVSILHAWKDPETGNRIVQTAYRKEDLYHGEYLENAPDIIISWNLDNGYSYLSKPSFRSQKGVPISKVTPGEMDKSDFMINRSGSHRDEGIFVISGKGIKSGHLDVPEVGITSIAPTVLYLLDVPIPTDMDGQVLLCCFKDDHIKTPIFETSDSHENLADYHYTDAETDEVTKKLSGLGYL